MTISCSEKKTMRGIPKTVILILLIVLLFAGCGSGSSDSDSSGDDATSSEEATGYAIVDTGQTACYDANGNEITCPAPGDAFYGQDAQSAGNQARYTDNGDGYFWSSTSAYFGTESPEYYYAWYVAFGTAVDNDGADTHGAGAVRFDTKVEGGALGEGGERYYNYVRLVRDAD